MPLHRGSFDIIKTIFATAYPAGARESFDAKTPVEQVSDLLGLVEKDDTFMAGNFGREEIAAFILIYQAQTGKVTPAQALKLRETLELPAIKGWSKPLPYVNFMALVAQWPEEHAKIPEMAATVSFASISGDPSIADTFIAAGVRSVLGMGGLEDTDEAVGPNDPIMRLFIDAVKFQLMTVTAPAWFSKGVLLKELPAGVDGRSAYELAKAVEAEKLKARAEARRVVAAKRRQEQIDTRKAKLAAFCAGPITADKVINDIVVALMAAPFADLKQLTEDEVWLTADLQTHAKKYEVAAPAPLKEGDAVTTRHTADTAAAIDADTAVVFVQQYVLGKLAAAKPDWFTNLANGDLSLRRGIGTQSTGVDRAIRSIRYGVTKLMAKFSDAKVLGVLKQFVENPEAMKVELRGGDDDEEETAAAPAAAAKK